MKGEGCNIWDYVMKWMAREARTGGPLSIIIPV